ncbi:TIGR02391 family protein [Burkholderia orbicola]|uniref:TIGR02391 family protein n=1 Tax=Burkholderia orbicola TaxID=2978683 RepID=UPI0035C75B69
MAMFTQGQLEAIADALGDTTEGLTGTEIGYLIQSCQMSEPTNPPNKRTRIYNAFAQSQNERQERTRILGFIRKAMNPARHSREPHRYEPMRANVNRALSFAGLKVTDAGELQEVEPATTLSEAEKRARELRSDLEIRNVHPDVLRFCREELLVDDYFHAVQEAVKSVADKIRQKTGLTDDGSTLVDRALGGDLPLLAINARKTSSERSEQSGLASLIKGAFSMFRNPSAHEARIHWPMTKADAEDLLTLVSLIHRRLDRGHMPPRV